MKQAKFSVVQSQKGRRVMDEGARTERISMALTEDEIARLDAWMFEHRQRTRSEAIRQLMRIGYETAVTGEHDMQDSTIPPTLQDPETFSDADWQRIAEAMAETDERPTHEFVRYVPQAKLIVTAVNAMWGILVEKIAVERQSASVKTKPHSDD